MKVSRRIAAIAAREVKRLAAIAAERAAALEGIRRQRPSFRPLSKAETEAFLSGELLAALIRCAPPCQLAEGRQEVQGRSEPTLVCFALAASRRAA